MKTLLSLLLLVTMGTSVLAQTPAAQPPVQVPTRINRATNTASPAATNAVPPAVRPVPPRVNAPSPTAPTIPAPTTVAQPAPFTAPPGARTAPGIPGTGTTGASAAAGSMGGTNFMRSAGNFTTNSAGEKVLKSGAIKFQAMPLEQVLDIYAELIGRTVLRPASLPAAQITLKTQSDLTIKEAIEALDSVLTLNGISTVLVGTKFVTIVPTAQVQQEAAAFNSDTNAIKNLPEAGQYTTRVVELKYIKPSDVVPAIQPFGKVQNGILAIDNNGILILRDNAANLKRMLEIIEKVDVAVPLEEVLEVIPIRFALAADIAGVLSSLTGGGAVNTGTGQRTGSTRNRLSTPGNTLRSTPFGATPGVGGVNAYPGGINPGFNNPQGINTPGNINVTPGAATSPASFSDRLRQSLQSALRPGGSAGSGPLFGEARILPDERTNSLLVFGTTNEIAQVKKVITQLDVVQAQVLIEAIILEVSLDNTKNLGVSSAQVPSKSFLNNLRGFGGVNNGSFFSSTNAPTAGNLPNGFSYFASIGNNWQVALDAVATDGSVNVLSRPRIQTFHATEASLFVGDTVPYITGTIADINGGARSQYQQTQVGITLSVLPLINPEGLVVMDIQENIEQLGTPTIIDGNPVPTTTKRQASAKVAVQDGETILLGGFVSSIKTQSKSGVPYLKDIPGFGALFRSKSDTSKRVELVVLMRPTVLRTPEVASITASLEKDKLAGVKRAEMQIQDEERKLNGENEAIIKRMRAQEEEQKMKQRYEEEKNPKKDVQKP